MKKGEVKRIVKAEIERLKLKICCTTTELDLSTDAWHSIDYHLTCVDNLITK